jgi:hypothetical protein
VTRDRTLSTQATIARPHDVSDSFKFIGQSSESHHFRATSPDPYTKVIFSVSINNQALWSLSNQISFRRISAFGLIRLSSKHLRQSIELGVKPPNGLVLARALSKRFDQISIPDFAVDCEIQTVGLGSWLVTIVLRCWTCLILTNFESVFESKGLADPSRL